MMRRLFNPKIRYGDFQEFKASQQTQQDMLRLEEHVPDEVLGIITRYVPMTSEEVLKLSRGKVSKAETIKYDEENETHLEKPIKGGLLDEDIFGKFAHARPEYREYYGHIELAMPVVHPFYTTVLDMMLGLEHGTINRIANIQDAIVADPGESEYKKDDILQFAKDKHKFHVFDESVGLYIGKDAVKYLLSTRYNPDELRQRPMSGITKKVLGLIDDPSLLVINTMPVAPVPYRPFFRNPNNKYVQSDLIDSYKIIIRRSNRLGRVISINAPDSIIRHQERLLQKVIMELCDNKHQEKPSIGVNKRPLKSLLDYMSFDTDFPLSADVMFYHQDKEKQGTVGEYFELTGVNKDTMREAMLTSMCLKRVESFNTIHGV